MLYCTRKSTAIDKQSTTISSRHLPMKRYFDHPLILPAINTDNILVPCLELRPREPSIAISTPLQTWLNALLRGQRGRKLNIEHERLRRLAPLILPSAGGTEHGSGRYLRSEGQSLYCARCKTGSIGVKRQNKKVVYGNLKQLLGFNVPSVHLCAKILYSTAL